MSKYTTGEVARLCGVTVRTVQYYDTRGILSPSELTEGGRRLYSEDDVKRMKIVCFLRELGLSIEAIRQLLTEEDPGSVISLLLDEQEAALKKEIGEREEEMLEKLSDLRAGLKSVEEFSLESIGDIAYTMTNRRELKKTRAIMLLTALPLGVLQWASVILWIARGIWQLVPVWAVVAVPYGVILSRWYFRRTAYICPGCHTVFQPKFKEAFWANHTPAARKLTCPSCGRRGFCVEVSAGGEEKKDA